MSINTRVWLQAIATAVPSRSYTQPFAHQFMSALPMYGEKERRFLDRIYRDTGIAQRHSVIDDYGKDPSAYRFFAANDTLLPEPTVAQRNDLFVTAAEQLSQQAAGRLFSEQPHLRVDQITHLVTVSCTGFSAPGFDYQLIRELGLSPSVHRYHIGFMGCYAGFPAIKLAHTICSAAADARVLIVDVELCTLHFQFKPDPDTMVANALFADGAAAAVVSAQPPQGAAIELVKFFSRVIPESEQAMSWRLGNIAFDMKLSAYVPKLLGRDIGRIVEETMQAVGLQPRDVRLWAIHPGGRAILDRIVSALALEKEALADSYATLRDYGNMSSATIFFVLRRMLDNPQSGPVFGAAFGPGLTVESAFLRRN